MLRKCHQWHRSFALPATRSFCASAASNNPNGETRIQRQVPQKLLDKSTKLGTKFILSPRHNPKWQVIQPKHFQYLDVPSNWDSQLDQLQQRIGVRFNDVLHLKTALVHHGAIPQQQIPSDVAVHRLSNRSLEFLGDSLLGMATSSFVFQSQPFFQEGQLTQLKSTLVNNETLSKVAVHDLQIEELILVAQESKLTSQRDEKWYRKARTTIQAGAVESLIAAVYLDKGLEEALAFVNETILPCAIQYATEEHTSQPVVELQHLLQAHGYGHPVYSRVVASSVSEVFQVKLYVRGEYVLTGEGASYKEARVNAARAGCLHFSSLLTKNCVH